MTCAEKRLLRDLAAMDPELAFPFVTFVTRKRDRRTVRLLMRRLARKGYTEYVRGLFDDDGRTAGAGYRITAAGLAFVKTLEDTNAETA